MTTEVTYFSLQDTFLNYIRKNKIQATIFLSNGVKMQGIVVSFDNFSLMLKKDSYFQFVYKHAISTIVPSGKFDMQDLIENSVTKKCPDEDCSCDM